MVADVHTNNASNKSYNNVYIENLIREFLSLLFGWTLSSENLTESNAVGNDLLYRGEAGTMIVQVSSTSTHYKIQSALKKAARFSGAHFLFIIIDDHIPVFKKGFETYGLSFDPRKDIYDTTRLYDQVVHHCTIETQKALASLVEEYYSLAEKRKQLQLYPLGNGRATSIYAYNAKAIPFIGRNREMETLLHFVKGDPNQTFAWWAITGPGGAGKTRLAFELQEALLREGEWDVGVIPAAVLKTYEQQGPDLSDACPGRTLLIVDYVQRYTGALALLLQRLSDPALKRGAPLRLLLLERDIRNEENQITWWGQLWGTDYHVHEACFERSPMVLAPMAATEGAADPLEALIRDFADALYANPDGDCPMHRLPEGKETGLRRRLEEIDPGLLRPLIAMILTEAWVRDPETEHWTRDGLLNHIVDREWDMVAQRLERYGDPDHPQLHDACRVVWMTATVLSAGASPLSCDRLPALLPGAWKVIEGAAEQHADALESWTMTPSESLLNRAGLLTEGLVQPLRPDLLGEYFVLEGLRRIGRNERSTFYNAILREFDAAEVFFSRMLDDYAGLLRDDFDRQAILSPEVLGLDFGFTAEYALLLRRLFERSSDSRTRNWLCERLTALAAGRNSQNEETARICENAASVLGDMGNYVKALQFYEKSLKIKETVLGPEHPDTAQTYNNMANVYDDMGDYPKALEFYEKALKIREAVLGPEHPDTAATYNNMAIVYRSMGDFPKALQFCDKARNIREALLGPEHPDTAGTYNNMAIVYAAMGDYPKALEFYSKARMIQEALLGPEHPDTATTYNNLAVVFNDLGDYPKALEFFGKALKVREAVLGPEHPDTAATYLSLALLYFQTRDLDNAVRCSDQALEVFQRVLGPAHPYAEKAKRLNEFLKKFSAMHEMIGNDVWRIIEEAQSDQPS